MMGNAWVLIALLIITTFLFSSGCTQSSPTVTPTRVSTPAASVSPALPSVTRADLVAFVQGAAAYAKANGKERALAEFDKRNGPFFKGELYIYAYDYNGTTIAHPVNPEKIGVNRLGERDAYGNLFIQDLREAAYNGSGFSEYYYINPVHNNAIEKKLGYVVRVDDSWWLGSGIYEGPVDLPGLMGTTIPDTPEKIKEYVDRAAMFARQSGKQAALAEFNNPHGAYVTGNVYIYALDYDGVALALPFQPDLVGESFYNMSDAAGQKFTQTEINLVKNGGGFLTYRYPNPAHNFTVEPKLSYVRSVDDTYWIGAGTYLSENRTIDGRVRQFVEDAKAYARTTGKTRAIAEFNNKSGAFVRDDLYIFAYDYNGTVLAWPYRPDQVGLNRIAATDLVGHQHIREMVTTAKKGSGVVLYYSENPLHNNATELKSSYVTDVDGTYFIGSGKYTAPGPVIITLSLTPVPSPARNRDDLTAFVQNAKAYALLHGKDRALTEFNNRTGAFVNGELYIFAYTYDGTTLALPFQPELLGVSRMGMTDADGTPYIREMAHTARGGSGFVDYWYPDPSANFTVKKKTSYVADVDGTWFVGSGLYTGS